MQQMQPMPMPVWFVLLGLGVLAVIAIAIVTIVALAMGKAKFSWLLGIAACLAVPVVLAALVFGVTVVRVIPSAEPTATVVEARVESHGPSAIMVTSSRTTPEAPPAAVAGPSSSAAAPEASSPTSSQPSASASLPEWASQPETIHDGVTTLVLSSQRFVTQEEAETQLAGEVAQRVRQYFHDEFPGDWTWDLPSDYAVRRTVKLRHVELIPTKFSDDMTVDMKRVHWQLELSPGLRKELQPLWREQVVQQRLTRYGGGVGAVALMLLISSVYNRVNASTHGAYRGWLRLAAVTAVAAGGATAWFIV